MTILPRFLALVSALVLPLALVVVWADQFVTDTDGYVETVGPLAEDQEVQAAAAARLAAATNGVVRTQAGPQAARAAGRLSEDLAITVVDSDAFARVWRNANGLAHHRFEQVVQEERNAPVILDLSRVVDVVVADLRGEGVPVADVDTSNSLRVRLASSKRLDVARGAYTTVDRYGLVIAGLWLALLAAALATARDRRAVVALAAAATAVTSALLYVALSLGDELAVASISATDQPLVQAVYDVLTRELELWALVAVAASLVVAALAAVLPRAAETPQEA